MGHIVAFCGIDGAGKTTTIQGVSRALASHQPHTPVYVVTKGSGDVQKLAERLLSFQQHTDYMSGHTGQWYALSAAIDFARHLEANAPRWLANDGIVLSDRFSDCYISFARAIDEQCATMIKFLLGPLIKPALTIFIEATPLQAWERILRRGRGPAKDESLELLERFHAAYHQEFAGRNDIVRVQNTTDPYAAVKQVLHALEQSGITTLTQAPPP